MVLGCLSLEIRLPRDFFDFDGRALDGPRYAPNGGCGSDIIAASQDSRERRVATEIVDVWELLERVGLGPRADDPDAPISSHRAAWRSVASHMAGIPSRNVLSQKPEEALVVHGLLNWLTDLVRRVALRRHKPTQKQIG